MSVEQNKAVVRQWLDACNSMDLVLLDKAIDEGYSDDYIRLM